ncbi:MAG TPA: hypothetical protein VGU67_02785 [Edaphobacter sp.]|nr:hypothetical protein [Edaphobacter sp.]
MHDQKLEVEKKGEQPVNKKKTMKNAARKVKTLKPVRRFDPATERLAFRCTPEEKARIQDLAIADNSTDSRYIREVMRKHIASLPPDEE